MMVLLNFFICSMGGFITMCRMTKMSSSTTLLMVRWQHVLLFCVFCYSGWSFLFDTPATTPQIAVGVAMVLWLLLGSTQWRSGPPMHARRRRHA